MLTDSHLKVTEIFYSLQGESVSVGIPTVFVRLTGCPLRCSWCDTAYAFSGGQQMGLDEILAAVAKYDTRHVTVTGGEPLAQKSCGNLLSRLCDEGYQVSLETSGALDIAGLDQRVVCVMDLKTPSSGEVQKNCYENIGHLKVIDQIKFVIADREDYEWARDISMREKLFDRCQILFSPVWGTQSNLLADWILADHLPVRFQLQLHKLLWGDVPGH